MRFDTKPILRCLLSLLLFLFVLLDFLLFLDEILMPRGSPPNYTKALFLDPCIPSHELRDVWGTL